MKQEGCAQKRRFCLKFVQGRDKGRVNTPLHRCAAFCFLAKFGGFLPL
jgi:hypothetical protein